MACNCGILLFLAIGVGTVAYKYVYDELLKGHVEWARTDYLYNEIKYCFMYGGIIVSCVVASFAFNKMKDKKGRIGNLTLPASQFEKYMVRWLVTVVLSMLAYVMVFVLADTTRCMVLKAIYSDLPDTAIALFPCYKVFTIRGLYEWRLFISIMLFCQSIFFFGSAVMLRYSLIKTFAIMMIGLVGYSIFMVWIVEFADYHSVLSENACYWFFAMAAANYVLAYYRYREAEVIHRLF